MTSSAALTEQQRICIAQPVCHSSHIKATTEALSIQSHIMNCLGATIAMIGQMISLAGACKDGIRLLFATGTAQSPVCYEQSRHMRQPPAEGR